MSYQRNKTRTNSTNMCIIDKYFIVKHSQIREPTLSIIEIVFLHVNQTCCMLLKEQH